MKKLFILLFGVVVLDSAMAQVSLQSLILEESFTVVHRNHAFINIITFQGLRDITHQNELIEPHNRFLINPEEKGYYTPRTDTTISDSIVIAKQDIKPGQKDSDNIPQKNWVGFQFRPGISLSGDSAGLRFNGKLLISIYASPKVSIGVGSGYVTYITHLEYTAEHILFVPLESSESENFQVSFVPVFLNVTYNLLKKRITPLISFDLGLSIPTKNTISGSYTYHHNFTSTTGNFKVDNIKTGGYFGFAMGVKYYMNHMFEAGFSLGFDGCLNAYEGKLQNLMKDNSHFSRGFCINLVLGLNLN